jgi:hypothetical protein
MPDANPLYLASAHRVAQRVEGITDEAEDLPNADLFEHADQDVCYHLSHLSLLRCCDRRRPCGVQKIVSQEFGARPSFQGALQRKLGGSSRAMTLAPAAGSCLFGVVRRC